MMNEEISALVYFVKPKVNYFRQINTNTVSDSRKFWITASPLFSEKLLKENIKTVTDNYKLAKRFNKFFSNIVQNLGINSNLEAVMSTLDTPYLILSTIKKYENHSSIVKIKRKVNSKKLSLFFTFVNKSK